MQRSATSILAPGTTAAKIRDVYLGAWNHRCKKHLVELREDFSGMIGSINPIIHVQRVNLNWRFLQRVHKCDLTKLNAQAWLNAHSAGQISRRSASR